MRRIFQFALTVRDYDEAIMFFVDTLGFHLLEDTDLGNGKRWVIVAPHGIDATHASSGAAILLARATTEDQIASVGRQTGGRVFIFVETDDLWRDYEMLRSRGVIFVREPTEETYGTVAVFQDLYGNLWDLIQPKRASSAAPA